MCPLYRTGVSLLSRERFLYRVSQELRSLLRDLIPELILSQKLHIHMGPIRNGSGVTKFKIFKN